MWYLLATIVSILALSDCFTYKSGRDFSQLKNTKGRSSTSIYRSVKSLRCSDREEAQSSKDAKIKRKRTKTTSDLRWDIFAVGVAESPYNEKFGIPRQATICNIKTDASTSAVSDRASFLSDLEASDEFAFNSQCDGRIVMFPGFEDCISEIDGFDFIWVISLMHLNSGFKKKIRPMPAAYAENKPPDQVGLFASRSPHRPNPIALSALKVVAVDVPKGIIYVNGIDLLNDTPILDIKPYIPAFDSFPEAKAGWMDMITTDRERARMEGYQNIVSPRGQRQARKEERESSSNDMQVAEDKSTEEK